MKRKYRQYILLPLAALTGLLAACSQRDEDAPDVPEADPTVAVNVSRAEGAHGGNYTLLFWGWKPDHATLQNAVVHSLADGDAEGEVNHYRPGKPPYQVTQNGETLNYPADNSPIHAVGYYPAEALDRTTDNTKLTIKNGYLPGFVDVCSTFQREGSESAPFVQPNDTTALTFYHTLAKVQFQTKRTENVNGHLSNVAVTVKKEWLADTWEYDSYNGTSVMVFKPTTPTRELTDLTFTSGREVPFDTDFHPLEYWATTSTAYEEVYLLPSAFKFDYAKNQAYLDLHLSAKIVRNEVGDLETEIDTDIRVYLVHKQTNRPWNTVVKGSEAFIISIVFDQNKLDLWGQKEDWVVAETLVVPLNPAG